MSKFFKKTHKWVGLVIALLIISFSLSGIVLNHRDIVSSVDIPRSWLPDEYDYRQWNNAAVRSTCRIGPDSMLIYGNIGVWLSDSAFSRFTDFNQGFPKGIDSRKIFKILKTDSSLLAGTLWGLYWYNRTDHRWVKIELPVHEENVVDMLSRGDSVLVLTRSHLLQTTDLLHFTEVPLPAPAHYDNKVSLFKTLWMIHSGEIYGQLGKLIVDGVAVVFLFLSVGGIILFFVKRGVKSKSVDQPRKEWYRRVFKWNLKWHNKIGWITAILLFFTVLTGMFLRPPLLIPIAKSRVAKVPFTELDAPNPWFDVLRRIVYIPDRDIYIVSTSDGFYLFDSRFSRNAAFFPTQPPASVMGVTVLEYLGEDELLVGSFSGLFRWNISSGAVFDVIKNHPYLGAMAVGPPVGDHKVTGLSTDFPGGTIVFDYDKGAVNIEGESPFTPMPDEIIRLSPMSLWNLALEIHTARIYGALMGSFYILIVPLGGLLILLTVLSGYMIRHKKKVH